MGSIIWKNDVKTAVIHKIKCGGRTTPIGAGTPFNANGEIANDGTAIGISAEESVYPHRCCVDIIVGGCVDERERLASSGIELTSECKAALKNIKFVDVDNMASSFGNGNGGGGADIDVTATVGQTIVVEEVDANGKPTKWEAADYQPRTHWSEEGKVQVLSCETNLSRLDQTYGAYVFYLNFNANVNNLPLTSIHSIEYDGVEYTNLATVELQGNVFWGNLYALNAMFGTSFENTGEPFVLSGNSQGAMMLTFDTQATIHTVRIYADGTYRHPLNMCYFPEIPTIDLTGYYSAIEWNSHLDISGDNLFEELYEVMRKNEIVRVVHRNVSGDVCSGIGFVARMANYNDLFVEVPSSHGRTLRIQAPGETATLFLS